MSALIRSSLRQALPVAARRALAPHTSVALPKPVSLSSRCTTTFTSASTGTQQRAHKHAKAEAASASAAAVDPIMSNMTSTSASSSIPPVYIPRAIVDSAVKQASEWASLPQQDALVSKLAGDDKGVSFVMKFTDWVMRCETPKVAASFLTRLVSANKIPDFMSFMDKLLVQVGATFAPLLPSVIVNSARFRMRTIVSSFIGTVDNVDFKGGMNKNVNLLGEAVLGDREALKRREEAEALLEREGVDYVSVKVSGVCSQLNKWDFEGSLDRVVDSLRPLFEKAKHSNPTVLINLDMEEYHDLELTIEAFTRILSEPEFQDLDAGIVLQAYLPDSLPALEHLVHWANNERPGTGQIKIRLVKGANLAMEKVDAEMHGWEQAPYTSKSDTDANYLRCLDWVFDRERLGRVRIGVASHNLFTLAYAKELAQERGVVERVGFEQLSGMTPSHTPVLAKAGHGMLLYTPVCRLRDFDVAISYLFRRFEETSQDGNFLRCLPTLTSDSPSFKSEEQRFRAAYTKQHIVHTGPRRVQQRPATASHMTMKGLAGTDTFLNEPNSDPTLPNVREWALDAIKPEHFRPASEASWVRSEKDMEAVIERARHASTRWSALSPTERREILHRAGDIIACRRGDFMNAMVNEGFKTIEEADPEISEAVDFATYYGIMAEQLPQNFEKFGVVSVVAPWNFPSAIGAGGAFASLAAGNSVILKPSPNTPRCLELVAECAWEAGVPKDVLQFIQCPENEVGKKMIMESDAVILTGATDTADLFRSWKSDIRLFAETSGKNSMIITPAADMDLAVADLIQSAFGNAGQKCSASSLAICVGDVYKSERFLRQLKDAAESLVVGLPTDVGTNMGPCITKPEGKLHRALTTLEDGEEWLVEPKCLDSDGEGRLWTPGVRLHVKPGSFFHRTEVFGPVLGLMQASSLEHALELQNGTDFGLTGGLHSLDHEEIKQWSDKVEVGNAYINRGTTGAIVARQCFGGWKGSAVGPGAKAGGPNYVAQLGVISDDEERERDSTWLALATNSDEREWHSRFSKEEDAVGLFCESNAFQYKPLPGIAVRIAKGANSFEAERVRSAIQRCGVDIVAWSDASEEDADTFAGRVKDLGVSRVRVVGETENQLRDAASNAGIHVADAPVLMDGRYELLHYLREQTISRTLHRFGNMVTADE